MSFISYLIILLISLFFNLFPRRASLFFGKLFGLFIYYILPIRKKVALQNIKDNFPELNNQKKLKILKNTYIHFGMILSDFLRTKKLNENNINNIIYMDDKTRKMLKHNKGAIIMDGINITDYPIHLRSRLGLGYLPQENSIFRGLTV